MFKYYPDSLVTLRPHRAKKWHYPSSNSHLVLERYSGGWPVPRAPSSFNGNIQMHT